MNKNYLILGLCGLLAFAACNKEEIEEPNTGKPVPETPAGVIVTDSFFTESAGMDARPVSKVDYAPEGNAYSVTWTKGDCIYVTNALEAEEVTLMPYSLEGEGGETSGRFVGEEISGKSFTAVYSKAIPVVSEDNKIEVLFPSEQKYVENGLESHLVPMYAVTSDPKNLKFKYGSGIVRLNLYNSEEMTISKIEVETDVPASGVMYASAAEETFPSACAPTAPKTIVYNVGGVTVGKTLAEATEFNIALAASSHCEGAAYKSILFRIYTTDGKVLAKLVRNREIKAGTVHEFPELSVDGDMTAPSVDVKRSTSTTLTYAWSQNGFTDSAEDRADSYEIALYSDAQCSNLVVSWTLAADKTLFRPFTDEANDAYADFPAFTFTGLAPETDYWFKVKSLTTGAECLAEAGRTEKFDIVKAEGAKVAAGGTVLAEDFSELLWGADFVAPAAGYIAADRDGLRDAFSKASGANPADYEPRRVSTDYNMYTTADLKTAVAATERLGAWDYITEDGGSRAFACASYLRLGSGSNTANIVTPVLSNLEDGKAATLTVKFKAAPYYDTNKPDMADPDHIHVAVVNSVAANHKYADCTIGNVAVSQLNGVRNEWKEYTLEVSAVTSASRLAIGTYRPDGVSGYVRMFLDDVVITVKKYDEVKARLQGATSSTLSFQWSGNNFTDIAEDTKNSYTVALYKDAACTDKLISWELDATSKLFAPYSKPQYASFPAFTFSGLSANTTYYFKVTDKDNGLFSEVISGKTSSFENVTVGTSKVEAGGTVLAEDFSELLYGGDLVTPAAGYTAKSLPVSSFDQPTAENLASFEPAQCSYDKALFYNKEFGPALSGTRLDTWGYKGEDGTCRIFGCSGYLRIGSGNKWFRVATPVLSNLKDDGKATLTVSFKAAPYYDSNGPAHDPLDACIYVLNGGTREEDPSSTQIGRINSTTSEFAACKFQIKPDKNTWHTYTYDIPNVSSNSRIAIGTYRTVAGVQQRMFIDDIKISVKSYETAGQPTVRVQGVTSSTLSFQWSVNGFSDKTADCARSSKVALYGDSECKNLIVSWNITDKALYDSKQPAFTFTGLEPNTSYYFKVTDLGTEATAVEGLSSAVVSATTSSFNAVGIDEANKVEVGGTVLAEDFSELVWGANYVYPGIGYYQKSGSFSEFTKAVGAEHSFATLLKPGADNAMFGSANVIKAINKTRLADWGHLTNEWNKEDGVETSPKIRLYYHSGYVKLGVTNYFGRIVTPKLLNLKGMAKVKVSFKACPYGTDSKDVYITVLDNVDRSNNGSITRNENSTEVVAVDKTLTLYANTWTNCEFEVENVGPDSRISIGPKGDVTDHSTAYKNRRMLIDDIVISVVSYNE